MLPSPALIRPSKSGPAPGTFNYDIGLMQEIAAGDPALTVPNVYRVLVTFTGATD